MFQITGMNYLFSPFERNSVFITNLSKGIYCPADISNRIRAQSTESLSPKYTKPTFDLVKPGGMGRGIVEMDIRVTGYPSIVFRLVDVQIVQNDMQFLIGRLCHDTIHEVEELASPSFLIMSGIYQSCSHFQGSKQGNSAMTFILMIKSPNGLTILKAQPALCSFLSLNGGLLIHAENQGIFRWVQIERDDVRCFLGKLRIGTQTPTMTTLKVNAMFIKYPPDLIRRHIPQSFGH
jgi:hypothetical protein